MRKSERTYHLWPISKRKAQFKEKKFDYLNFKLKNINKYIRMSIISLNKQACADFTHKANFSISSFFNKLFFIV